MEHKFDDTGGIRRKRVLVGLDSMIRAVGLAKMCTYIVVTLGTLNLVGRALLVFSYYFPTAKVLQYFWESSSDGDRRRTGLRTCPNY